MKLLDMRFCSVSTRTHVLSLSLALRVSYTRTHTQYTYTHTHTVETHTYVSHAHALAHATFTHAHTHMHTHIHLHAHIHTFRNTYYDVYLIYTYARKSSVQTKYHTFMLQYMLFHMDTIQNNLKTKYAYMNSTNVYRCMNYGTCLLQTCAIRTYMCILNKPVYVYT